MLKALWNIVYRYRVDKYRDIFFFLTYRPSLSQRVLHVPQSKPCYSRCVCPPAAWLHTPAGSDTTLPPTPRSFSLSSQTNLLNRNGSSISVSLETPRFPVHRDSARAQSPNIAPPKPIKVQPASRRLSYLLQTAFKNKLDYLIQV